MSNTLTLTKEQRDAIAWLQSLASSPKDERYALECVRVVGNGAMTATDGFVLGYWTGGVENLDQFKSYVFTKAIKNGSSYHAIAAEHLEQNFPKLDSIAPKEAASMEFYVNPQLLIRALKGFGEYAKITIYPFTLADGAVVQNMLTISDVDKFAVVMLRRPYNSNSDIKRITIDQVFR